MILLNFPPPIQTDSKAPFIGSGTQPRIQNIKMYRTTLLLSAFISAPDNGGRLVKSRFLQMKCFSPYSFLKSKSIFRKSQSCFRCFLHLLLHMFSSVSEL
ncbi:hypothetical protein RchiOBHm_Chr3g0487521 [Rosa chinensis]|uniref:Uncharacterized protein n=1 Tax=Rosa chinensis TaxID=74649 RepID=A0A2P6RFK9_ROSCH|nr:hypothetical protein RchiOBHm_Chr3g0487521 [Rosa chinensis]